MNYRVHFMHVSEDERHHESDKWKKERTGELKGSRLQPPIISSDSFDSSDSWCLHLFQCFFRSFTIQRMAPGYSCAVPQCLTQRSPPTGAISTMVVTVGVMAPGVTWTMNRRRQTSRNCNWRSVKATHEPPCW